MSIERTIVQRLFESRGLSEASFESGGHVFKCVFGKYYMDDQQITRDDYFKAKEQSGGSASTADESPKSPDGKKVMHFVGDDGQDVFYVEGPDGEPIVTDEKGNPVEDKPKSEPKKTDKKKSPKKSTINPDDYLSRDIHGSYMKGEDVDRLYKDLKDGGYKLVRARAKDANHNREGFEIVFSNGENYVSYSRKGGSPNETEKLRVSKTEPKPLGFKFASYDNVRDLTKGDKFLGMDDRLKKAGFLENK